jgi:acylphosphatase
MRSVHLLIKGKVQGVFYRASAKETAEKLNIVGTVRNTEEGDVEIVATGDSEKIMTFIEWCRRRPSRARIEKCTPMNYPFNNSIHLISSNKKENRISSLFF